MAQIIKVVMTSEAEVEILAIYGNVHESIPQRIALIKMWHPQSRTPIQTNNSAAHSVVTKLIHTRKTKAVEILFLGIRCQDSQGNFSYYWRQGK